MSVQGLRVKQSLLPLDNCTIMLRDPPQAEEIFAAGQMGELLFLQNPSEASLLLGHTNGNITERVYRRVCAVAKP